ncbi:MAG TPA: threonine/serine dehydratase [Caulobacteraceae bacterium]|jgi:threonine dehydratase
MLPTFDDVLDAARRLDGVAVKTPLLTNAALDAATGAKVFVKAECLQRTGSFKFRGAYNRICRLTADELTRGVTAFSSGNHAQGVAAAAALMNTPAVIVMPSDAPKAKVEGTRAWGAEVVLYDRWTQSREEIGARIAKERGAVLVPPFDDLHVIAGQGTVGLEAAEQLQALGESADLALAPASGGGLIAGVGLAFGALSPATRLYAVEPEAFDDHAQSLKAGRRVTVKPEASSRLDALLSPFPGELTFPLNSRRLAGAVGVSDAEAMAAVAFAFRHLKLVLEPSGAAALAAVLSGKVETAGRTILVVASGGNVDAELYAEAIG